MVYIRKSLAEEGQRWCFSATALLHIFRCDDAEHSERPFELSAEVLREPEQEGAPFRVFFGEHGVAVIEVVKRLRELKGVLGDVGRFAGTDGTFDRRVYLGRCK